MTTRVNDLATRQVDSVVTRNIKAQPFVEGISDKNGLRP